MGRKLRKRKESCLMNTSIAPVGYLPEERPGFVRLLLYAIQQVIVMFPATVTVALVTGFQVSTTIFASGLATLCFILITGKKIPLYYGSSFAYLTAISSMCAAEGFVKVDGILPTEAIQYAQFGIIFSGLVSIAAGLLVRFFGRKSVEAILPATITGPVAMIIGLTLAGNALSDAIPNVTEVTGERVMWTVVALVTLVSTIPVSYTHLRALQGLWRAILLSAGIALCTAVLVLCFAGQFAACFDSSPAVIEESVAFLKVTVWSYPLFATVGPLIGFIRGTGNVEASILVGVVAQLFCRIPASFIFSAWMGFPGVGVAVLVGPLVSVSIYLWYILTGRWHKGLVRVAQL